MRGLTVVITGASSGIGRGTALRLAADGARVVVAARRRDALEALVADIRATGGEALAVTADVSSLADVDELARQAILRYGGFDVWINNVGIGALGLFWKVPAEDHARIAAVNLCGLMHGSHVSLNHFLQRGSGVLLNIGSVESAVALAYQASYAATKAAVRSLGRSLSEELRLAGAPANVAVGTIMPWAVDTPWWAHAGNYTRRTPRMLAMDDPMDVVDAIARACVRPRHEQPVGWKARLALGSHRMLRRATDRAAGVIMRDQAVRGRTAPTTSGAIYRPMPGGTTVDGGVRRRVARENADASRRSTPSW